jgi:hypothetical protein
MRRDPFVHGGLLPQQRAPRCGGNHTREPSESMLHQ